MSDSVIVLIAAAVAALILIVVLATRRAKAKADKPAAPPRQDTGSAEVAGAEEAEAEAAPTPDAVEAEKPTEAEDPTAPRVFERPDVQSLRRGLAKSRGDAGLFGKLKALFSGSRDIDSEVAADIEEILITSDVGVATTETILERVRESLAKSGHSDPEQVWNALRDEASRILSVAQDDGLRLKGKPTVVLMVGVNGAGKTTTIGKLATRLKGEGKQCVLAAGDTFRAAAVQQLEIWGQRVGCDVVKGNDGADPASVIFDAVKKAEEIGADVVLADTAGRLHTKTNLMVEMEKIVRTAGKALDGAPHEILLVLDATNGQNALAQAREFCEALPLTGLVLTKLDGTAKGGVVLGICDSLKLPVRFVGLGERASDLHEFAPVEFVEALLGRESEANAA